MREIDHIHEFEVSQKFKFPRTSSESSQEFHRNGYAIIRK